MSMQSVRAVFTGVEPYVDVALNPPFAAYAVLGSSIACDETVAVVAFGASVISSTTIRVEPTNLFVGHVDLLLVEI